VNTCITRYPRALTLAASLAAAAGALAGSDFNGDGIQDLAIGVPNESVGNLSQAGMVQIFYGTSAGGIQLTNPADQVFHQDTTNINGVAEASDHFGKVLATGDFDGDGFDDLAVGTPDEDSGDIIDAGVVNIIYGSASGLSASGDQYWQQGFDGVPGAVEANDHFASALAAGDFNGDGFCDLAIGIPDEKVGTIFRAGAVEILYGSAAGLGVANSRIITQNSTGILDSCESSDEFGTALAAEDFGNDHFCDLAIGAPWAVTSNEFGQPFGATGAVFVVYDVSGEVNPDKVERWGQGGAGGLVETPEAGDRFGECLAAGNFGRTGATDLAVGVPGEDSNFADVGAIHLIYSAGNTLGLDAANNQSFTQNTTNVEDQCEANDTFGSSLGR
jgi:hypothetical protein